MIVDWKKVREEAEAGARRLERAPWHWFLLYVAEAVGVVREGASFDQWDCLRIECKRLRGECTCAHYDACVQHGFQAY